MADRWVIWMKDELRNHYQLESVPYSIFRVPVALRSVNPQAFTPKTVAIGPFHSALRWNAENTAFTEMERTKVLAAKAVAYDMKNESFGVLVEEIVNDEKLVRSYYDGGLELEDLNTEQLAYMVALDAAFVVAILHSSFNDPAGGQRIESSFPELQSRFAPVFSRRFSLPVRKSVLIDFLLLENQIPLFVLRKLIQMDSRCKSQEEAEGRLESYVALMAHHVLPFTKSHHNIARGIQGSAGCGKHLLDCLYRIITHQDKTSEQTGAIDFNPVAPPSATQLYNAGVKFKGHNRSLMEISFERYQLTIPKIHVGDDTETIFRNLVAYESQLEGKVNILSYLHFMNFLINTPQDVTLLVNEGIITHSIGNEKHVAQVWNELTINTVCAFSSQYSEVAKATKHYLDIKIHGLMAEFVRQYFSRPWLVLSLISGIVLLVMTFLTMLYTILVYKKG